jgi:hypothetical protein
MQRRIVGTSCSVAGRRVISAVWAEVVTGITEWQSSEGQFVLEVSLMNS